jgi:hypothetical protein
MIPIVSLTPFFHGQIGPLDELELLLAPIVVVITLLAYKLLSRRSARHADRTLKHRSRQSTGKDN